MANKKEGVALLAAVPLFSGLSQRDLGKLWDSMKAVKHRPGHVIMAEGNTGLAFQLITNGDVRVERKGKTVTLGPGAFFGEMAIIDGGVRTATVTAVTEVESMALNGSTFKSFVQSKPALMWQLLVHTTARLRDEQSVTRSLSA